MSVSTTSFGRLYEAAERLSASVSSTDRHCCWSGHLKELKLPTFLIEYGKIAAQCASEGVDHPDYLLRLAELELIDRHHRMVARRIKAARFSTLSRAWTLFELSR